MNEAEWLTSENPATMLEWVTSDGSGPGEGPNRTPVSPRKLRLYAVAVSRLVRADATHDPVRGEHDATAARAEKWADTGAEPDDHPDSDDCWHMMEADPAYGIRHLLYDWDGGTWPALQAALLRDVVGNPWKPVRLRPCPRYAPFAEPGHVDPRSLTPTVLALARNAYDERRPDGTLDPDRLAVLADALEDAGCVEETLLRHLRGQEWCYRRFHPHPWMPLRGPHTRGCHVLDLLLGLS